MNKFWFENINKGLLRGPWGKEMVNFNFYFKISRAPPARKFKVKIEIDHFGEGPGAYIPYKSFNGINKTWIKNKKQKNLKI